MLDCITSEAMFFFFSVQKIKIRFSTQKHNQPRSLFELLMLSSCNSLQVSSVCLWIQFVYCDNKLLQQSEPRQAYKYFSLYVRPEQLCLSKRLLRKGEGTLKSWWWWISQVIFRYSERVWLRVSFLGVCAALAEHNAWPLERNLVRRRAAGWNEMVGGGGQFPSLQDGH